VAGDDLSKRRKQDVPAPLVRVTFIDHAMSAHPHWHDGDLPPPPKTSPAVCVAVGWMTFADDDWLQVLHVTTKHQHGHYCDIARACVVSVEVLGGA
jgi:hypothetical protein